MKIPRSMVFALLSTRTVHAFRSAMRRPTTALRCASNDPFFSDSFFSDFVRSKILLQRLARLNLKRPTSIQAKAYDAIAQKSGDVTVGAETGTGKTLAYLLPILDDILLRKEDSTPSYNFARALLLVPNKELVQQLVRMALPLCGDRNCVVFGNSTLDEAVFDGLSSEDNGSPETQVRLAILPGGLETPRDFPPFRKALAKAEPPLDLVISTPAAVGPFAFSPKHIDMFADIETLVVDEADMLLDGGYIQQLNNVFMGFRRADKASQSGDDDAGQKTQHVFVAATIPDHGKRSVDAYIDWKFPKATRITLSGMHNARHYGLSQSTQWMPIESKKDRMTKLVEMLNGELKDCEKIMVFLNSVQDVESATEALLREGIKKAIPFHAKIPLSERTKNLNDFRNGGVLVCTDLASRGLDVPGVNVVIQLMFAGNVVSHLHRMGRCGRAGQKTGRGIVFYGEKEAPLVHEIRKAESQQEKMVLEGDVIDPEDDEEFAKAGKVNRVFSRKRSFNKNRKRLLKWIEEKSSSSSPSS